MKTVQFIPVNLVKQAAWDLHVHGVSPVLFSRRETLYPTIQKDRRRKVRKEVFPLALSRIGDLYSPRKSQWRVESFFSLRSLIDQVRTRSLAGTLARSWTALVVFGTAA